MKQYPFNLKAMALGFFWVLPTITYAAPGTLAQQPLWLTQAVKHNVLYGIDSSGSMDFEIMMDGTKHSGLFLGADGHFVDSDGNLNFFESPKYVYLFPNGYSGTYNGQRFNGTSDHHALPPIANYAFARSADYNKSYYDPAATYEPWPSYGTVSFGNASLTATKYEPSASFTGGGVINLFASTTTSGANFGFNIADTDMPCTDSGVACTSTGEKHYTYYPATYYLKDTSGSYTISGYAETYQCSDTPSASRYKQFVANPSSFTFTGAHAIGLDGSCLKKYEISGTDTSTFVNGAGITRTVLQEKQNFANWFSYYRRRHQALRGAVGKSLSGLTGLNASIYWMKRFSTIDTSNLTMRSLDNTTSRNTLLADNYNTVPLHGGTYVRDMLAFAGEQFSNNTSIITEACQKNYALIFTDGLNDRALQTAVAPAVGNADLNEGSPYQDSQSDTLGDIAMKYYDTRLRTTLAADKVAVPTACSTATSPNALDCNNDLHMNTYAVAMGVSGNIMGNTHSNVADVYTTPPDWDATTITATSGGSEHMDDLLHAAVNGRGEIYSASKVNELGTLMTNAMNSIVTRSGSGSGVSFDTSTLRGGESQIFVTSFDANGWKGDVKGHILKADGTISTASSDQWSAQTHLDNRIAAGTPNRTVLSYSGTSGVPFQWANISASMQNDLRISPSNTTETEAKGQARLAYLRGEDDGSANGFRLRNSYLGDFVHSSPSYVGKPASYWPNEDGVFGKADSSDEDSVYDGDFHTDFKNHTLADGGASDRIPMVYAGSNDGMLHGFIAGATHANKGKEVLAYVPSFLANSASATEGLHYLTDPSYSHRYYVDLAPGTKDVYITPKSASSKAWRTVLVGGAGAGGKGIFMLDVTNPATFSETNASKIALWEFSGSNDADMGHVMSTPQITMLENDKWAVIFGNGYESATGVAKLMILFLEEGMDGAWTAGTDYLEISTQVGSTTDKNGLSGVALADMDGNSKTDRVYAGDLKGNLWVFDLSSTTASVNKSNWYSAYYTGGGTTPTPVPLFRAADTAGKAQPITHDPNIALNTAATAAGSNVLVTFGTGQYLVSGDLTNTDTQTYYTVWDHGSSDLDRSDLTARALTNVSGDYQSAGTDMGDWSSKEGWYFDFILYDGSTTKAGERLNQKPVIRVHKDLGPIAIFSTIVPSATSACEISGKSGMYAVPMLTGESPDVPIADLDGDGDVDSNDLGMGANSNNQLGAINVLGQRWFASHAVGEGISGGDLNIPSATSRAGRLGWHEMVDEE